MTYSASSLFDAEIAFAQKNGLDPSGLEELRDVRAKLAEKFPHPWYRTAAFVVAPVLTGFTRWIARRASMHESPRLLCVMRQGRVVSCLLDSLFNIKAREVWINRDLAMRAAFGRGDDEALLNWMVRTRIMPLTGSDIFRSFDIENCPEEWAYVDVDLALAKQIISYWSEKGVLELLRERFSVLSDRLWLHWQQSLRTKDGPVMLIDFAAAGNIQRSMQTLLRAKNDMTLLMGQNFATTTGTRWAKEQGCTILGFLSENGWPQWIADLYVRSPELMELFVMHPVGALNGYDSKGNPSYDPSLLDARQKALLLDTQDRLVQTAFTYNESMGEKLSPDLARCVWGRFLAEPFMDEVMALADWPLDGGLDGRVMRKVAPVLSIDERSWTRANAPWLAACRMRAKR